MTGYNGVVDNLNTPAYKMNENVAAEKATRQFVTIDGQRIGYIAEGSPAHPPLVLVHGWLSHAGFWRGVIDTFRDTHYCLVIDHLGFGFSDKPANGDYSIPAQAQRLLQLTDSLGLKQFSLMGHSMGGQIALCIASTAPERVQKVITVDGVVTGALTPYFKNIYRLPLFIGYYVPQTWLMSRIGMRYFRPYKWIFSDFALTYQRDVIPMGDIGIEMALVEGIERPAYLAFQALQQCDLTPQLSQIKAPVLIVHGAQDNTVPVASAHHAHHHIPGSKLVIFNPCGHTPTLEVPEQFFPVVMDFLRQ